MLKIDGCVCESLNVGVFKPQSHKEKTQSCTNKKLIPNNPTNPLNPGSDNFSPPFRAGT